MTILAHFSVKDIQTVENAIIKYFAVFWCLKVSIKHTSTIFFFFFFFNVNLKCIFYHLYNFSQKCADIVKQHDFSLEIKKALHLMKVHKKDLWPWKISKSTQKSNKFLSDLVIQQVNIFVFIKMLGIISTNWCCKKNCFWTDFLVVWYTVM